MAGWGNAMPRKSRKPPEHKRTAHIDVRLTENQKTAIEKAASRLALDPSTWLRMVGLDRAGWNPDDDPDFSGPSD